MPGVDRYWRAANYSVCWSLIFAATSYEADWLARTLHRLLLPNHPGLILLVHTSTASSRTATRTPFSSWALVGDLQVPHSPCSTAHIARPTHSSPTMKRACSSSAVLLLPRRNSFPLRTLRLQAPSMRAKSWATCLTHTALSWTTHPRWQSLLSATARYRPTCNFWHQRSLDPSIYSIVLPILHPQRLSKIANPTILALYLLTVSATSSSAAWATTHTTLLQALTIEDHASIHRRFAAFFLSRGCLQRDLRNHDSRSQVSHPVLTT